MHPKAEAIFRDLPDELDLYVDDDGDLVTVACEGHAIAFYRPRQDHIILQPGLLIESSPDTHTSQVHASDLASIFDILRELRQHGIQLTDHRVEYLDGDRRESILMLRLDGIGVPAGFILAVLIWVWEESVAGILRSNEIAWQFDSGEFESKTSRFI